MFIIESIHGGGIKTTNAHPSRLYDPRPGDVIDFGENVGTYPYTSGRYGRIDEVGTDNPDKGWCNKGEIHVCCGNASVFLMENGDVSISGGPFSVIRESDLEYTGGMETVGFWNWGDNSPGAGQGVYYRIERPVFKLRKLEE